MHIQIVYARAQRSGNNLVYTEYIWTCRALTHIKVDEAATMGSYRYPCKLYIIVTDHAYDYIIMMDSVQKSSNVAM